MCNVLFFSANPKLTLRKSFLRYCMFTKRIYIRLFCFFPSVLCRYARTSVIRHSTYIFFFSFPRRLEKVKKNDRVCDESKFLLCLFFITRLYNTTLIVRKDGQTLLNTASCQTSVRQRQIGFKPLAGHVLGPSSLH